MPMRLQTTACSSIRPRRRISIFVSLFILSALAFVPLRRSSHYASYEYLAMASSGVSSWEMALPSLSGDARHAHASSSSSSSNVVDNTHGISACLLIKDVNHLLPEWIAYHYHFLPMRYLIVAVDPHSRTSPRAILQRFNDSTLSLGLTIHLWRDEDYLPADATMPEFAPRNAPPELARDRIRNRYLVRQDWFMSRCLAAVKAREVEGNRAANASSSRSRSWTFLHDADEFVTFNRAGGSGVFGRKEMSPPSSVANVTLLDFIERTKDDLSSPFREGASPCFEVPRLLFGSKESSPDEISRDVPAGGGFDPMNFATLRYRHHVERSSHQSGFVKPIVDAALVPDEVLSRPANNPHKPYKQLCNYSMNAHTQGADQRSSLLMHHYVGTLESYSYQRKWFLERYNETKDVSGGRNDEIRPWLGGFVKKHGVELASKLLDGAGTILLDDDAVAAAADEGLRVPYGFSNESLDDVMATIEAEKSKFSAGAKARVVQANFFGKIKDPAIIPV